MKGSCCYLIEKNHILLYYTQLVGYDKKKGSDIFKLKNSMSGR